MNQKFNWILSPATFCVPDCSGCNNSLQSFAGRGVNISSLHIDPSYVLIILRFILVSLKIKTQLDGIASSHGLEIPTQTALFIPSPQPGPRGWRATRKPASLGWLRLTAAAWRSCAAPQGEEGRIFVDTARNFSFSGWLLPHPALTSSCLRALCLFFHLYDF